MLAVRGPLLTTCVVAAALAIPAILRPHRADDWCAGTIEPRSVSHASDGSTHLRLRVQVCSTSTPAEIAIVYPRALPPTLCDGSSVFAIGERHHDALLADELTPDPGRYDPCAAERCLPEARRSERCTPQFR